MKQIRLSRALTILCCLALTLCLLNVLSARAASVTVFYDDFSGYTPGEDTFYGANTNDYVYYSSYHGTAGSDSYSTYGIAEEDSDRFLRLTSCNATRNWFVTRQALTDPFTVMLNVRLGTAAADNCTPSFVLNPFQGNTIGSGTVLLYVDPKYGVRLSDAATTGSAQLTYMRNGSNAIFKPDYDTWYTVKLTAEVGRLTVAAWPKGESEPEGSAFHIVWQTDLLTESVLAAGNQLRLENIHRSQAGLATVTDVDDLTIQIDGGELGSSVWTAMQDDFSAYEAGEDTFYDANRTLYTYFSAYHGEAGSDSYSTYGIVTEGSDQVLELTSYNTTRNWYTTKNAVSGAYDISLDVKLIAPEEGAGTPSFILNPFEGKTVGSGTTLIYVDAYNGSRISDGSTTGTARLIYGEGSKIKPTYDAWYCVKVSVRVGKLVVKIWPRGGAEPAEGANGSIVWTTPLLSSAELARPSVLRIHNMHRGVAGKATAVRLDNFSITKPYDSMTLPAAVYGLPHEALRAFPTFTGQDLSRQSPTPLYHYTLADPALGVANAAEALILGPGTGFTTLTAELADLEWNGSGATVSTDLYVGCASGVTADPSEIVVAESAVGDAYPIALTYDPAVTGAYPDAEALWSSSDETVAAVSDTGTVTLTGVGTAVITAEILSGGEPTGYYANIPVQVGEPLKRVLFIGNSFSRDTSFYMGHLARLAGKRVEACYLQKDSGSIRHHARNVAQNNAEYSYWKGDPDTGVMTWQRTTTIQDAMSDGTWDVIVTHSVSDLAGMTTVYDEDLHFLLDYIRDAQPSAQIYWNMTWAYQQTSSGTAGTKLRTYYNSSQAVMYNAIVNCMEKFIVGAGTEFGSELDGWLPVGAAIQNLRATYGDDLTRDGYHLSLAVGRLTAAMTAVKTLYPDVDLSIYTAESVSPFLDLDQYDEGIRSSDATTYDNTEANMTLVRAAVAAATADLTTAPSPLSAPAARRVEDETSQGDYTLAQSAAPMKLHFPDVIVLKNGTVLLTAYEGTVHKPNETAGDTWLQEGPGRLLVWKSTDNGATFGSAPLLVVDQAQMEAWGVSAISDRYSRWKSGTTDYVVMIDPRDPNFGLVYTDVTGDGVKDEVLLFTFWVFKYKEVGRTGALYMTQSIDGGETWSAPQLVRSPSAGTVVKRGDITAFSDGQILVPTYVSNQIYVLRMGWNAGQSKWTVLAETAMTDFAPEETNGGEFNEMSLIAPDPKQDTVYGFIRANGTVVKSTDRGATWSLFANESGTIHQPGFARVDKNRVFVTWARATTSPRTVYGKMFNINGAWDDTSKQTVYASPETSAHDMGDPSAKLLANGQILTVSYDTAYRSIVGSLTDPGELEEDPVAMPGDMTGDDKVNGKDISMLQRYVAGGYGVVLETARADLNHDGKVNGKDISILQRYVAGGYGVVLTSD